MNLLDKYLDGYSILKRSIEGLTPQKMKQHVQGEGAWSIHEIVIHVVDADLVYANRIKAAIAEENPLFTVFDQDLWTKNLGYHNRNIDTYLELFLLTRKTIIDILKDSDDYVWKRTGRHPVAGELTVQQLIEALIDHVSLHVRRIERIKQKMSEN